jgi:leader peptidase (prepilin peptidase)/N-methyltransferase
MDNLVIYLPLILLHVGVFAVGACVGSMLNVCIIRLPQEKSLLWPESRCGKCLQPIRSWHNLPILGWVLLRGRCAVCGVPFSVRYPLVELFTAIVWVGLFHLELVQNWQKSPFVTQHFWELQHLNWSASEFWMLLAMFLHHAVFASFLIVAAATDIDGRVIPLSVTVTGTVVGLAGSAFFPWPWPLPASVYNPDDYRGFWYVGPKDIPQGLYFWPAWLPLPAWMPPGHWLTGLLTGLAGAAFGTALLRLVGAVFSTGLRKEALGLGDADLMMMAGAFLGWQPVLMAFFLGAVVALVIAVPRALWRGDNTLPFGPGLAIGLGLTWLGWPAFGPVAQGYVFDPLLTPGVGAASLVVIFVVALLLGRTQGRGAEARP